MKRVCKICRYEWKSRASSPKECPQCKSRDWRTGKKEIA